MRLLLSILIATPAFAELSDAEIAKAQKRGFELLSQIQTEGRFASSMSEVMQILAAVNNEMLARIEKEKELAKKTEKQ